MPSLEVVIRRPSNGLPGRPGYGGVGDLGAKSTACIGAATTLTPGNGAIPVEIFNTDHDLTTNELLLASTRPSQPALYARVGFQCVIKFAAQIQV